jgi:membrane protease YdiL (CAAX protease family)
MLATLVIVLGLAAEMVGWWLVSAHGRDVWRLMPVVLVGMAAAASLMERGQLAWGTAADAALGAAVGLALYVGTRLFVWAANHWEPFRRQVAAEYGQAATITLSRSLVLSLVVMVPAEELFWRAFTQAWLDASWGAAAGAAGAWLLYVVANAPSRSLPIVAGAIVGGGVWVALWWATGGVLAPLGSHILWTGLMLALPLGAGPKVGPEVGQP